jgi:hypothetical protein
MTKMIMMMSYYVVLTLIYNLLNYIVTNRPIVSIPVFGYCYRLTVSNSVKEYSVRSHYILYVLFQNGY